MKLKINTTHLIDAFEGLKNMHDQSVDCIVTSPPYWMLRDYGVKGQIGLEKTPEEYVKSIVTVFKEANRVLKDNGTLWLNVADTYYGGSTQPGGHGHNGLSTRSGTPPKKVFVKGLKEKDLIGIPWMLAFALRESGWFLRQDIIWQKPNAMPESVIDRCTKSHEYIFLFSKSKKYYYDHHIKSRKESLKKNY